MFQGSPRAGEENALFGTFSGAKNGTKGHPLSRREPVSEVGRKVLLRLAPGRGELPTEEAERGWV